MLLTQVYLVTQASGSEMFPAVKDGDLVLGIRLEKDYAKNDVVVYERSGTLRVGRVLARGGDIVTLSESGVVEVNGSAQGGGILYPTYPKSLLSYPYAVPEDSVFILGDCRTQAEDSRDFGPAISTERATTSAERSYPAGVKPLLRSSAKNAISASVAWAIASSRVSPSAKAPGICGKLAQ